MKLRDADLPFKSLARRQFLKAMMRAMGAGAAGWFTGGCWRGTRMPISPTPVEPTVTPKPTDPPATIAPTVSPPTATLTARPTATASPKPTATVTPSPTSSPSPTVSPLTSVALASASHYDATLIRQRLRDMLDGLGGVPDIVRPGDSVAIKVNLTGGTGFAAPGGGPATERFVTHPQVVLALAELLRDAGAGAIFIVEAVYEWASYQAWGYEEVARALNATLLDLNNPQPFDDFVTLPVGTGALIYQDFITHRLLQEVDVFVSVAKMKTHGECGITLAMKNLIGLVPAQHYLGTSTMYRLALHGPGDAFQTRLPRVIMDLNQARPIHLALIDGIRTAEGGEGPWRGTFAPVAPGVLVAGKNPVATDAVAAAVMGFDPDAASFSAPFVRCENYLTLARTIGLGPNRLEDIQVVGESIESMRHDFKTA